MDNIEKSIVLTAAEFKAAQTAAHIAGLKEAIDWLSYRGPYSQDPDDAQFEARARAADAIRARISHLEKGGE